MRRSERRGGRRDIDDHPAATAPPHRHDPYRLTSAQDDPHQVDVNHTPNQLHRGVGEVADVARQPSVANQACHGSEPRGLTEQAFHILLARDVGLQRDAATARLPRRRANACRRFGIGSIAERDVVAGAGQSQTRRRSNSPAATGDDRHRPHTSLY